jgi:hypothetical protein
MSREFDEELGGCLVGEAWQPGAIAVVNKAMKVGVAFGMIVEAAVVGGTVLRHPAEVLAQTAVEPCHSRSAGTFDAT